MTFLRIAVRSMSFGNVGRHAPPSMPLMGPVSFDLAHGDFVSILGPSGCGKTTLLRIIAGLERRFEGEVVLNGTAVTCPSRAIQVVFQDGRLLPWKTVADNLAFALPRNGSQEADLNGRILDTLRQVRLLERKDAWPATLSGGEETRCAVARALLCIPELLLLDEPFRNLDMVTRNVVQAALIDVATRRNSSVLQVSHSVEDAAYLSDVVYCFAARPMRLTATFQIDVPRPRSRSDPRLREYEARIRDHLIGAGS